MTSLAPWESAATEPSATSLSRRGRRCAAASRPARTAARFWIALWVAAVVAELLALRPVLFDHEAPIQGLEVVLTLIGGSFAAFGLIAWRRRPDSRSGMLMTATGFRSSSRRCSPSSTPRSRARCASCSFDWWIFFFVALILTLLTSGRLQSRLRPAARRLVRAPARRSARSSGCCSTRRRATCCSPSPTPTPRT